MQTFPPQQSTIGSQIQEDRKKNILIRTFNQSYVDHFIISHRNEMFPANVQILMSILLLYFTSLAFDHILAYLPFYLFNYLYQWYTRMSTVSERVGLDSSFKAAIVAT